jgi:SAM-dependent methyltransferase
VIYEDPRAYLLGLEGIALLRAFTGIGDSDRDFVEARLAEIRSVLADESLANAAVEVDRIDTVTGYRLWSATYDQPNTAFDADEAIVQPIIDALPAGVALDAACGTGRYAQFLAERGHQVIGVDGSPEMLVRARVRVPKGTFLRGALDRLPVADGAVDLVVCTLALTHVRDLGPVIAEFARVLCPGGHLLIADIHPEFLTLGSIPHLRDTDGRPGEVNSYRHLVGDYIRAALSAGLQVRRCEEPVSAATPREASNESAGTPELGELGPWDMWPWTLLELLPEAARAASAGIPGMLAWHFQAPES